MKKNIIAFSILALTLFSCGNDTSGGNKNILPADTNTTKSDTAKSKNTAVSDKKTSKFKKDLQWTAFKFKDKTGVNGTFKTISLTNTQAAGTMEAALEGAKFTCDGTTVSTGDVSRDGTLNTFFFKNLSTPEISGSFGKFKNNKVPVTITLNGKTVTKDFTYALQGNEITLKGSVDIIKDFAANTAFDALHKACFDLHMGKTWTDVDITVKISK